MSASPVPIDDSANSAKARLTGEIIAGDALSFAEAAKLLPAGRGFGTANPATVWKWHVNGAKGAAGQVVHLEAVQLCGRQHITSRAAIKRFLTALTSESAVSRLLLIPSLEEQLTPLC